MSSSIPEDLPPGWAATTLGEVCQIFGGATPDTKDPSLWGDDIPWLTPADLAASRAKYVASGSRGLTQKGYDSCSAQLMPAGSVLFSSRAPIGYVAITTAELCTNQGFKSLVPPEGVSSEYLYWFMRWVTDEVKKRASGTTFAEVSGKVVAGVPLLLPPTAEQDRIAQALGALLTDTAEVTAQLTSLERSILALRQSVLRAFLPRSGEPTISVGEMAELGSGATPAKSDAGFYVGGRIPWLTSGDLNTRVLREARLFITERAFRETSVRLWPAGTLLVAMYGEGRTRGRAARLAFPSTTNQACAAIRLMPDAPVSVNFLHGFFDATYHRNRLLSAGGVQPNLSLKVIRGIRVPVRPPAEEEALVTTYEAFLEQQNALLGALEVLRARVAAFERRTLSHAFAGQLVEQAAYDEPAELLLKRITEEREAKSKSRRPAKGAVRKTRTARSPKTEETTA